MDVRASYLTEVQTRTVRRVYRGVKSKLAPSFTRRVRVYTYDSITILHFSRHRFTHVTVRSLFFLALAENTLATWRR